MPGPVNLQDYQKRLSHLEETQVRLIQRIRLLEGLLGEPKTLPGETVFLSVLTVGGDWTKRRDEALKHETKM
jgi:hypothetical protein